jgi:hypothetical protein
MEDGDVEESHLFYCEHRDIDDTRSPYDWLKERLRKCFATDKYHGYHNWGNIREIKPKTLKQHGIEKIAGLFDVDCKDKLQCQACSFDNMITIDHDEFLD